MGTYTDDIIPDLREALAVGSAKDDQLLRGLKRNARYLLRNYNFPESITYYASSTLADGATGISLPSGVGKIRGVRLALTSEDPALYQVLRRREESVLPTEGGPVYWRRIGEELQFEMPLELDSASETYVLQLWYQTVSPDTAESWLTDTYADVLLHRTAYELAPPLRKPEAQQVYGALWQEDMTALAIYLNELEFEGAKLGFDSDVPASIAPRYGWTG